MSATQKLSRWQISRSLARSAWRVLKLDRSLVGIPLLSGIVELAVGILFFVPVMLTTTVQDGVLTNNDAVLRGPFVDSGMMTFMYYVCFYLVLGFVGTFFSGALIAGILERFRGGTPTVSSALKNARSHLGALLGFSLLSSTIGFILQAIEERVPLAGKITTWLVGAAWAVASMFAVPVIVSSSKKIGPLDATKQSVRVIKKTWGESIILNTGLGIIGMVSILSYFATMGVLAYASGMALQSIGASDAVFIAVMGSFGALFILGMMAFVLVFIMLAAVVKAAIYHYAMTGETPEAFERDIVQASFTVKKAKAVFQA